MRLRFFKEGIDLIKSAKHALILGMILDDGQVRFQTADKVRYAGHKEWLALMGKIRPVGGFSLLAREGRVVGFFALSGLNATDDARLPESWITRILNRVPTDPSMKLYD